MNTESTDKTLSTILYLLTIMTILFGIMGMDNKLFSNDWMLKDLVYLLTEFYYDILIIGYIFICLQISGYVELKYRKDYLTVSILSVLLTPISLFFILFEKNEDEN